MPYIGQTRTTRGVEYTFTETGWERAVVATGGGPDGDGGIGDVPPLNPDDFWEKLDQYGDWVPAEPNEAGARFNEARWADAQEWRKDAAEGFPDGVGRTGPTAAELAIERSKVDAQNLSTFISGTVSELQLEIEAGRLETDQAMDEFNRRLDAFAEAGSQFQGIQPYTIPRGSEFIPGFEPEGIATRLGLEEQVATPIDYDPFGMASDIVAETPVITDIGVPSGDELDEALELARGFLGG